MTERQSTVAASTHTESGVAFLGHHLVSAILTGDLDSLNRIGEVTTTRKCSAEVRDWLVRHRLAGVVYESLTKDSRLRALLRPYRFVLAMEYERRRGQVEELAVAAKQRGFDWIAFKGWGVAHIPEIFPSPELRPLGDLDLLVSPEHLDRATDAALSCGYRHVSEDPAVLDLYLSAHQHLLLTHPNSGLFEPHFRLQKDISAEHMDAIRARVVPAGCAPMKMATLYPPDLLIELCVHLFSLSDPVIWVWLYEIVKLILTMPLEQLNRALSYGRQYGTTVYLCGAFELGKTLWLVDPIGRRTDLFDQELRRLPPWQRLAIEAVVARAPGSRRGGPRLNLARRLSGHAARNDVSWRHRLIPRAGEVAYETGVSSLATEFPLVRAGYTVRHLGKLWRNLTK